MELPVLVADEALARLDEIFGTVVRIHRRPGRRIEPADLVDADLLLVRSVTRVDRDLLEGSRVRWVGSATSGTDHVDEEWLSRREIDFVSAPGANAEAVAQYVLSALLYLSLEHRLDLAGATLGVVGCGQVGSRVQVHARSLGMEVLLSDPPLERAGHPGPFLGLDDLLAASDVVSLHVPLTRTGPDATLGLLDAERLDRIQSGAFLINTCRGGVLDEGALVGGLDSGRIGGAILDVFAGEPTVSSEVVRRCLWATPHIAGYTREAKVALTLAVYQAWAAGFGWPAIDAARLLPALCTDSWGVPPNDPEAALRDTGLVEVSARLRAQPGEFARLRTEYEFRREVFRGASSEEPGGSR